MLFMVPVDVSLPASVPHRRGMPLRARENETATRYMEAGKLRRIWRIVGQTANFGLRKEKTLEDLHATMGGLPLHPYMNSRLHAADRASGHESVDQRDRGSAAVPD
jgi:muconolactone D-isomerase